MTAKSFTFKGFKGFSLFVAMFSMLMFCFSSCGIESLIDDDDDEDGDESEELLIKDSKPVITEGSNWICISFATSGVRQEYKATYSGDKLASFIQTYTFESKELRDLLWVSSYSAYSYASKKGDCSIELDFTDDFTDYSLEQMRSYMEALKTNYDIILD